MRYKTLERVNDDYEEVFSEEQASEEMQIEVDGCRITISEQQCGNPVKPAWISFLAPDGVEHGMDFETFVKKITN